MIIIFIWIFRFINGVTQIEGKPSALEIFTKKLPSFSVIILLKFISIGLTRFQMYRLPMRYCVCILEK